MLDSDEVDKGDKEGQGLGQEACWGGTSAPGSRVVGADGDEGKRMAVESKRSPQQRVIEGMCTRSKWVVK